MFFVGRRRSKTAAVQYVERDVRPLLHIFFQTERRLWYH